MRRNGWLKALTLGSTLCLASAVNTAWANPVQWTLDGVTTGLGNTITGSFVYDADTNVYSDIDFQTSGGSFLPSETWTQYIDYAPDPSNSDSLQLIDVPTSQPNKMGANSFDFVFLNDLTNAGGSIRMGYMIEGTCDNAACYQVLTYPGSPITGYDFKATGTFIGNPVAAVPEPSTLAYFGVATALLAGMRLRARSRRSASYA